MAGTGRNRPYRKTRLDAGQEEPDEAESDLTGSGKAYEVVGAFDGPSAESAPQTGPVPRVCMGYFYVSSRPAGPAGGAQGMSTNELQNIYRESLGSQRWGPGMLTKRYQMYEAQEHQEELGLGVGPGIHAYDRPMMVMVDETTGNQHMMSVQHKGLGSDGDNS